jgi:uncharacterized protein DUF6152
MTHAVFRVAASSALFACTTVCAHHSYVEFDDKMTVEVEGTLVAAAWQNPHAHLKVKATDSSGRTWDIQTSPVNNLRRVNAPLELFTIGSNVKVAGWPSRRSETRMYGTNILSADGQELILWRAQPRWAATAFGTDRQAQTSDADTRLEPTIFRLWGSFYSRPGEADDPDASPNALWRTPLPLTNAARQAVAAFDLVQYNMALGCSPRGFPFIMTSPTPMAIANQGEAILLRIEAFDSVRTIHMGADSDSAAHPKTPLGYSVGHWDGATLVVETSHVNDQYLRPGVPLGPAATFVERFTPSEDGKRLHYTILINDPHSLTEPVEQKRSWLASNEPVLPFNCTISDNAQQ